jgi:hypothetical protein
MERLEQPGSHIIREILDATTFHQARHRVDEAVTLTSVALQNPRPARQTGSLQDTNRTAPELAIDPWLVAEQPFDDSQREGVPEIGRTIPREAAPCLLMPPLSHHPNQSGRSTDTPTVGFGGRQALPGQRGCETQPWSPLLVRSGQQFTSLIEIAGDQRLDSSQQCDALGEPPVTGDTFERELCQAVSKTGLFTNGQSQTHLLTRYERIDRLALTTKFSETLSRPVDPKLVEITHREVEQHQPRPVLEPRCTEQSHGSHQVQARLFATSRIQRPVAHVELQEAQPSGRLLVARCHSQQPVGCAVSTLGGELQPPEVHQPSQQRTAAADHPGSPVAVPEQSRVTQRCAFKLETPSQRTTKALTAPIEQITRFRQVTEARLGGTSQQVQRDLAGRSRGS